MRGEREKTRSASAFARGLLAVISVPAAVLFATALGFGALCRDGGFSLAQAAFITGSMFALPNQVVLVDQLARNETLAATALAVTFMSIRLLPMTATLIPLVRGQKRRPALDVLAAHFVAITTWIEGNRRLPGMPAEQRLAYFLGVGVAISGMMTVGTLAGYALTGRVPVIITAALLLTTPLYFVLSLVATSQSRMDFAAVGLGCGLAPLVYLIVPGFDLLVTGLVGGTLAFLWRRRT